MHNPKETHLQAIYRSLNHLKSTPRKEIVLKKNAELSLEAYTNANWRTYYGQKVDLKLLHFSRRKLSDLEKQEANG